MDPKACLMEARAAHDAGDRIGTMKAMGDYRHWRSNGGFEPMMDDGSRGDEFYRSIPAPVGKTWRPIESR